MNHYQKIESCGIFGHNGSTWAQVGMDHTQEYYNEITDLVGLFTDPSSGKRFNICYVIIMYSVFDTLCKMPVKNDLFENVIEICYDSRADRF